MLDIGPWEAVFLGVLALVILGPERLPEYAAQAAKFMKQLRGQVADAKTTLVDAAAIDPKMLKDLQDLDPRKVFNGVTDEMNSARFSANQAVNARPGVASGVESSTGIAAPSPLDPDTT